MAYNTAAKAYGNNRIETATPAELTLMLYEGAVKFCNCLLYTSPSPRDTR